MAFEHVLSKLELDRVLQRVIRYATSEPGAEQLQQVTISTSAASIREDLARVTEMRRMLTQESDVPMHGIFPVRAALRKTTIQGTVLSPRELLQVSSTLRAGRVLRSFILGRRDLYPLLAACAAPITVDKVIEYNIEQAIDETGAVRSDASKELRSIRRAISERYDQLRKKLTGLLRGLGDQGFTQDDIITTREGRMVIPVKSEHKSRVPGFIHSASASGATVFIEPTETLELNNDIRGLQFREEREVDQILRTLTGQVAGVQEHLLESLEIIASLDVLYAKAKYSLEILGSEPQVTDHGPIRLLGARHPLLILNHGYDETVPLDVELGNSFNTLIISGPNAGGKSVAMKTVGLLTLMVQAGLHIPASADSTVRVFGAMFVDIGDDQSIENDLSTFSSHLRNLKEIAATADGDSLVLIDEIGSGTDPTEGGALAASFLESLTQRGALTIATTHHGALKRFAYETPSVENGAMEFDQETLTPTYRFRAGIPGSSYAVEMAQRMGFERPMVERARALMGSEQTSLERLLVELEAIMQRNRRDQHSLMEERTRVDGLIQEYDQKIAGLTDEIRRSKRQAVEEARAILANANASIEEAVRSIREGSASKESIRAARERIHEVRDDLSSMERENSPAGAISTWEHLSVGDLVRLAEGEEIGEITDISPDLATVIFGHVKMKVPLENLRPSGKLPRAEKPISVAAEERPHRVARDIDLRGMTGDEAIPLVDKLIDEAVLAGLHRVDIIHGKGTGALRKRVSEFLAQHPRVSAFRPGEWNEGGLGATVVELRDE
jgi:DNA mismatch repair protein MutS2